MTLSLISTAIAASLTLGVPQTQTREQIDFAKASALRTKSILTPEEAVLAIASLFPVDPEPMTHINVQLPETERIISRVKWGSESSIPKFVETVDTLGKASTLNGFFFGLIFVTSAWDITISRAQLVPFAMGFTCDDPNAVLLFGRKKGFGSAILSRNWPWRKEKGVLRLGTILYATLAINTVNPLTNFLKSWSETDRDKLAKRK